MTDQKAQEWLTAIETELGLEAGVDDEQGLGPIDELAGKVRKHVGDAAVERTMFLVGVVAGRAEEPQIAAQDVAQKLGAMAEGWNSDEERGVPSNDQSQRG